MEPVAPPYHHIRAVINHKLIHVHGFGHPFRQAILDAKQELGDLTDFGETAFSEVEGWPSARCVELGRDVPAVLAYRRHGSIAINLVPDSGPYDGGRYVSLSWSHHRLLSMYRNGGTGITVYADVYRFADGKLVRVQALESYGELAMGYETNEFGGIPHTHVVDRMLEHVRSERFWTSHFGPGLEFVETWRFSNGRLHRSLRRISTPMAWIEDTMALADGRRRSAFDRRVPPALRRRLWNVLHDPDGFVVNSDPIGRLPANIDDSTVLYINRKWRLQFEKRNSHWNLKSLKFDPHDW